MEYRFKLLGALEVRVGGAPVVITAAKHRVLLASLLVDANRVVPPRTLLLRMWGEHPPPGARNTLQNYVLRLRRVLGDAAPIRTRPDGYVIEVPEDAVDLVRFTALCARAKACVAAGDVTPAIGALRAALELWRGEALSDVPSEVLHAKIVPALTEQRLAAVELRIDLALRTGGHQDVLPELHELTAAHPLRERFWAQRMLALHRSGRQSEALECYRVISAKLAGELGLDPCAELREAHARVLAAEPAGTTAAPPRAPAGNVPAELTSFVGREAQLDLANRMLADHRLVTLTGAGGAGKSRLALKIATARAFPDGVWLADLGSSTDGEVGRAIAGALGIAGERLVDHLRDRELLLVVDNCEHVAGPAAEVLTTLLRSAPGLRVLATSRQPLGAAGENLLPVPLLTEDEAIRLFTDRAVAAQPGFRLTPGNRDLVRLLCHRLDRIPLAVELAAARLNSLSVRDIVDRLGDRFRLLGGPGRPVTLRGVLDRSHALCTPAERLLWARISLFGSGFDLATAESVCSGGPIRRDDVIDLLAALVAKSIVIAVTGHERTRYSLLATFREYGAGKLAELRETGRLRPRQFHPPGGDRVTEPAA
ncbi:BTAD domain-containing putative transcriptional regulator [Amycolatopsis sp. CA-128772]|uniref:AfsR/SARP family transcriptional regulator n=1 Tax=Amycolatopsis sp. CA-128772 TaxID=2073159 RepID=UPI0013049C82|nr:BTAD domain-containing putative transcriptional regulator [Amycolatopsis sp. CA-128772]